MAGPIAVRSIARWRAAVSSSLMMRVLAARSVRRPDASCWPTRAMNAAKRSRPDRAGDLVLFGKRRVDGEHVPNEQSEALELDMAVALDPLELARDPVEPDRELLLELARAAAVEEGGERRRKDRGLGRARRGGERFEALAEPAGRKNW